MPPKPDQIVISQLGISTFIGVTDEERKRPQRLRVSVVMEPEKSVLGLTDDIESTIDYDTVSQSIKALAAQGQRHLIETLAEEIVTMLLVHFPLQAVEVEIRKFIMPDTEYVAVRARREAPTRQ